MYSSVESEIGCLREELQEWYDNLPEQFQDGDKGCELQDAISLLEDICFEEMPEELSSIVTIHEGLDGTSRAERAGSASEVLLHVYESCVSFLETQTQDDESIKDFIDELEELPDKIQAVEFPRMF